MKLPVDLSRFTRGTLLIPNEYLKRAGGQIAVILEVIPHGDLQPRFSLLFSNGKVGHAMTESLLNLYEVPNETR